MIGDIVKRLRECSSCAERRAAIRRAAMELKERLGLKSALEARRQLEREMGGRQRDRGGL